VNLHRSLPLFLFVAINGLSHRATAQELGLATPSKDAVLKVAALTQYVEGHVVRTETSGVQTDIIYQTGIYEGDRVETSAGSVAKFVSRTGCLFTLRGEGALAAPVDKKPWRMRAESLRLLCRDRTVAETFGVANVPLSLKNGEVLFLTNRSNEKSDLRAILLSGAASIHGKPLELHKLYSVETSTISEVSSQPDDAELRQLNLDQKPPRESYVWPEPDKKYTVRFIFGPVMSFDHVAYDNNDLSQTGLKGVNPRFQLHVRTRDDRSLIFAVTFRDADKKSDQNSYGPPPNGAANALSQSMFEFGFRNRHDRWWSP
jgi:hypothetical protein